MSTKMFLSGPSRNVGSYEYESLYKSLEEHGVFKDMPWDVVCECKVAQTGAFATSFVNTSGLTIVCVAVNNGRWPFYDGARTSWEFAVDAVVESASERLVVVAAHGDSAPVARTVTEVCESMLRDRSEVFMNEKHILTSEHANVIRARMQEHEVAFVNARFNSSGQLHSHTSFSSSDGDLSSEYAAERPATPRETAARCDLRWKYLALFEESYLFFSKKKKVHGAIFVHSDPKLLQSMRSYLESVHNAADYAWFGDDSARNVRVVLCQWRNTAATCTAVASTSTTVTSLGVIHDVTSRPGGDTTGIGVEATDTSPAHKATKRKTVRRKKKKPPLSQSTDHNYSPSEKSDEEASEGRGDSQTDNGIEGNRSSGSQSTQEEERRSELSSNDDERDGDQRTDSQLKETNEERSKGLGSSECNGDHTGCSNRCGHDIEVSLGDSGNGLQLELLKLEEMLETRRGGEKYLVPSARFVYLEWVESPSYIDVLFRELHTKRLRARMVLDKDASAVYLEDMPPRASGGAPVSDENRDKVCRLLRKACETDVRQILLGMFGHRTDPIIICDGVRVHVPVAVNRGRGREPNTQVPSWPGLYD